MFATIERGNFSGMSKRKPVPSSKTDQINFRFPIALIERMERYMERHPLRPTATQIAITAIAEWLDRNEADLPKR